jgi:perosamine synthetase
MVLGSGQSGAVPSRVVCRMNGASSAEDLISILEGVIPAGAGPWPLHEPEITHLEHEFVGQCLKSTFVSSVGRFVDEFENRIAEITGARHAIAAVNGTAALEIALRLAGVECDDEVIVPALSFVATANAVAHIGAVPHFVDSDPDRMGMDPGALKNYLESIVESSHGEARNRITGRRLAAIVPMHAFGHPVDMEALMELAGGHGISVVEDAAESLGSTINGKHTGTFGLTAMISFNGNKIVTTGGGGVILTNDPALAKRAKHLTTTAKLPHKWAFEHDEVAWNFRMPNLNAALGCAQLERLPEMLGRKRELAARYRAAAERVDSWRFMDEPPGTESNFWLCGLALTSEGSEALEMALSASHDQRYLCRPAWKLLSELPMFADSPSADLRVATRLQSTVINVPSTPALAGPVGTGG